MALPPGRVRLRAPVAAAAPAAPPVPVATTPTAPTAPRVTGRVSLRPRVGLPVAAPVEAVTPDPVATAPEVPAPVVAPPATVDPLRSGVYVPPLDASTGEPWSRPRPPAPALVHGPRVGAPRRPRPDPLATLENEPHGPPCPEALHPEWSVAAEAKRMVPF